MVFNCLFLWAGLTVKLYFSGFNTLFLTLFFWLQENFKFADGIGLYKTVCSDIFIAHKVFDIPWEHSTVEKLTEKQ